MGNKLSWCIFLFLGAFVCLPQGEAISCYVCESYNVTRNASLPVDQADYHASCATDPFDTSAGVPLVACDAKFNACYKLVTREYDLDNWRNHRNLVETYATRLCATRTAEELDAGSSSCEGGKNSETDSVSCYCNDGDGCNGSTGIEGNGFVFIMSVLFALCLRLFC